MSRSSFLCRYAVLIFRSFSVAVVSEQACLCFVNLVEDGAATNWNLSQSRIITFSFLRSGQDQFVEHYGWRILWYSRITARGNLEGGG